MRRYDFLVAGAGPVGLAAALVAAEHHRSVVVVDPHSGPIDKACGEGIMPAGVRELRRLGVRVSGAPFIGVRYLDASDPGLCAVGDFPRAFGLGVRRLELERALLERADELGVRRERGVVSELDQSEHGVRWGEIATSWLIAADGLHSSIRNRLGLNRPPRRRPRYGIRRHFSIRPWSERVEVYFAQGAEAYVTPVASDLVGVAILFGGQDRFESLLARFPALCERLAHAEYASSARGAGPFEQRVRRRTQGRVLLVGDAAGYVDPLTGEGVALGLATARAAVECALAGEPARYEARYRQLTRRHRLLTVALLAATRTQTRARKLIRTAAVVPAAFDRALGWLGEPKPPVYSIAGRIQELEQRLRITPELLGDFTHHARK